MSTQPPSHARANAPPAHTAAVERVDPIPSIASGIEPASVNDARQTAPLLTDMPLPRRRASLNLHAEPARG